MEVLKSKKPKSFDFGFLHALKGGLAEEEGFEPPDLLQSPVFKTGAINRSTTPLCLLVYLRSANV
jgi:hypothetical protein